MPAMTQMTAVDIEICTAALKVEHPELFHYTRPQSFEAMLQSQTLWSTYSGDLDDKNEIATLKPLLIPCVAGLFNQEVKTRDAGKRNPFFGRGGGTSHAKQFVAKLYEATFDKNDPNRAVDAYTTSFTTHAADSDFERANGLESQWSRYAPDGFCFVFDMAAMGNLLGSEFDSRDYTHLNLERVRYAAEGVPLREHFDFIEPAIRSAIDQYFKDFEKPEMAIVEFLRAATLLKRQCFMEEREVRIVAIPGAPGYQAQAAIEHSDDIVKPLPIIDTAPKKHVTMFRDASIKLPIKRVIVGPSEHQAGNAETARRLLKDSAPVVLSEIPWQASPASCRSPTRSP
jgi:hypothetical protein